MGKKKPQNNLLLKTNPELVWRLGVVLGEGTFGSVHKATNSEGQVMAMKICKPTDEIECNDLKQEAEIVSRCSNVYIIKATSCYDWDGKIWMVLEYCQGGALDSICAKVRGFDEPTIRIIMYQCTKGIQYLHANGIMHRDIKLQNIMLTADGICKIADFGVSAVLDSPKQMRGSFIGTPYWMAPEVLQTETNRDCRYDSKCDIYSLGITAHECMNGYPPGYELNPMQICLYRVRYESPEFENKELWSAQFQDWVNAALTKDAGQRPNAVHLLEMPFLIGDDLDNTDLLIELYKINDNLEVVEEFEVERDDEELTDSIPDSDEMQSEKDLSPSDTSEIKVSPPPTINKMLGARTVKKTIKYSMKGVEKKRTIIEVVGSDNKAEFERQKSMRDKIINQMRVLKLQEQRDQRKLEGFQKIQLSDLLIKHKAEFDAANDRYLNETDVQNKILAKEVEKKRNQLKTEFERTVKKIKGAVEKEVKNHQMAIRSRNKSKYDSSYLSSEFVSNLHISKFNEIKSLYEIQNSALVEFCTSLVTSKHGHLEEILNSLLIVRLQQLNEIFTVRKTHICAMLDLILQQRAKSDQKELQISAKYMQEKIDSMNRAHAQVLRDTPKIIKVNNKKILENLKKNLRRSRVRNEKEMLQQRAAELNEAMESDIRNIKAAHEDAIRQVELTHEKEIKEIQEYQDEKNRATHRAYQDQLYQRYIDDESLCKAELLKLYLLIRRRQQEYESELQSYKDIDLSIIISPDILN